MKPPRRPLNETVLGKQEGATWKRSAPIAESYAKRYRGIRIARWWIASAILILLGTSGVKLIAATDAVKVLAAQNPPRYVRIVGDLKSITYFYPPNADEPTTVTNPPIPFICTTGTNLWLIENTFVQNCDVKWSYDGTNVYNSILNTNPIEAAQSRFKRLGFATTPIETIKSNITVRIIPSPRGAPLGDVAVNMPWLAFCSGAYLKQDGRIVPLPVATLQHAPNGFAYSDKTETYADPLGLPRKVDLFTSEPLYKSSVSNFNQQHFIQPRTSNGNPPTAAFLSGKLKFHYEVTETTNFLGWEIPVRFKYVQNRLWRGGEWVPEFRGVGTIKSIELAAKPKPLFRPEFRQTIVDFRFRSEQARLSSLTYGSTNSFPIPPNDIVLQQKFQRWTERARSSRAHSRFKTTVVLLALLGALIAFPTIEWFRSKRQHQTSNESKL